VLELNEVLVPVDLSAASRATFDRAQTLVTGENPVIILLYVIDPSLVNALSNAGLGSPAEVARMAESAGALEVTQVVSEGIPFYEISRHADEFAVDAVVIGKTGSRDVREALFFGSTAEKVVRVCRQPVIVLSDSGREA
jgi:nucleotide-binding universal stress UspA family protein